MLPQDELYLLIVDGILIIGHLHTWNHTTIIITHRKLLLSGLHCSCLIGHAAKGITSKIPFVESWLHGHWVLWEYTSPPQLGKESTIQKNYYKNYVERRDYVCLPLQNFEMLPMSVFEQASSREKGESGRLQLSHPIPQTKTTAKISMVLYSQLSVWQDAISADLCLLGYHELATVFEQKGCGQSQRLRQWMEREELTKSLEEREKGEGRRRGREKNER